MFGHHNGSPGRQVSKLYSHAARLAIDTDNVQESRACTIGSSSEHANLGEIFAIAVDCKASVAEMVA
jgi:hypothetical protein